MQAKLIKNKISVQERLHEIAELLSKDGKVNIKELVDLFGVSGVTARSDLRQLESLGLLKRTRGGGIIPTELFNRLYITVDSTYVERLARNQEEKKRIGVVAAELIEDGETILMDDGTTTLYMAKNLSNKSLTLLTHGLNICMELLGSRNIQLFSTGGYVDKGSLSLAGKTAQETICKFRADKAILGASGISIDHGLSTPNLSKAELKKKMVQVARKIIVVADHTKMERVSLINVIPVEQIDILVTGREASQDIIGLYREKGINVICA